MYPGTASGEIPQAIVDDARRLATKLLGKTQSKCQNFVNEVLSLYAECRDKDLVIIFNPGGWGTELLEESLSWESIIPGIEARLAASGYSCLVMTYQRTERNFVSRFGELVQILRDYPAKARDLAGRVRFLTAHNPCLRVIIAGESMGTLISGKAMELLADNSRVFSVQTGPPFWRRTSNIARTLVMTGNGVKPDCFSHADIWAVLTTNVRSLFTGSGLRSEEGTLFKYIQAPGHDYRWQFPAVSSRMTAFLEETVGLRTRPVPRAASGREYQTCRFDWGDRVLGDLILPGAAFAVGLLTILWLALVP